MRLSRWVAVGIALVVCSSPAVAQPFLPGFGYRIAVTVSTSSALSDYQVRLPLDTAALVSAGRLQPTCEDVRFTSQDGTTLLPHWRESPCNASSTTFWVRVPSLSAPATTLFVYFGNPAAPDTSAPEVVNLFYDAFDSDPNTSGRWTGIYRNLTDTSNLFNWGGSSLFLLRLIGNAGAGGAFKTIDPAWENGWAVSFRYRCGGGAGPNSGGDGFAFGFFHQGPLGAGNSLGVAQSGYAIELDALKGAGDPSPTHLALVKTAPGTTGFTHLSYFDTAAVKDNQWHSVLVQFHSDTLEAYLDGALAVTYSGAFDKTFRNMIFGAGSGQDTNNHEIDDVVLRRYASPEPAIALAPVEPADRLPPSAPGPLAPFPNPSRGVLGISWAPALDTGGSGLSHYEVQRSGDGGGTWLTVTQTPETRLAELLSEGTYLYRVRALDRTGNASAYVTSPLVVVDTTPPGAPGEPVASPNPSSGPHMLRWSAATDSGGAGLASYELWGSADDGATWVRGPLGSDASYAATAATGKYLYKVRAADAAGNLGPFSAPSAPVDVDTAVAALAFSTPEQSLLANVISAPVTLEVRNRFGIPAAVSPDDLLVELSSSSPDGAFARSPSEPFTPTLRLAFPADATQVTFYYRDRAAGQATLTASAEGLTAATQSATITARDATSLNLGCGCGATGPGEALATLGLALVIASRRLRRARP